MSKFIPNSFQLPNAFVDDMLAQVSGNACKVYLLIVRKTRGWQKEKDCISYSQIQKIAGIKSHETIKNALNELLELGLIKVKQGNEKTPNQYRLNDNYGTTKIVEPKSKGTTEIVEASTEIVEQGTTEIVDTENNSFKTTKKKENEQPQNSEIDLSTEKPTAIETFEFLKQSLVFGSEFGVISEREPNLSEINALVTEVDCFWSNKHLTKKQLLGKILGSVNRLSTTDRLGKYTTEKQANFIDAPVVQETHEELDNRTLEEIIKANRERAKKELAK